MMTWAIFGAVLIVSEFILPGLVAVFVGMGALTVALLLNLQVIEALPVQFVSFFIFSTLYIFSLRLLVIRFYPSDRKKQAIDEVQEVMGKWVKVSSRISPDEEGRISLGDSTWPARAKNKEVFKAGSEVKLVGRDNITWLVERK